MEDEMNEIVLDSRQLLLFHKSLLMLLYSSSHVTPVVLSMCESLAI